MVWALCVVCVMAGFAREADAQQFVQVSVATEGTPGNAASAAGAFSGDGKIVAFSSDATNLVPGDTNGSRDVFVRDLAAYTTTRVSVTSAGLEKTGASGGLGTLSPGFGNGNISLNADGSIVAFGSQAALVDADTNGTLDIYVHNRSNGQTERVSVASDGSQATSGDSYTPHISADGRYVVFTSTAPNLVANDQNGTSDVFLHDRVTHTTTRLSVLSTGAELTAPSYAGKISGDGNIVVFTSQGAIVSDTDPLPCPPATFSSCGRAFVLDRVAGTVRRINIPAAARELFPGVGPGPGPPNGQAGGSVDSLEISSDGRIVAMGLGPTFGNIAMNQAATVVVYDRLTGRLNWHLTFGTSILSLSAGGRFVSVQGRTFTFLVPYETSDLLTNGSAGLPAPLANDPTNQSSSWIAPLISPDGNTLMVTTAGSQAAADTNNLPDVYVISRDRDGDGMPDTFETLYGLNPDNPNDATLDADGDGVTNLQEYLNATLPIGTFKRYFAEGAANSFFSVRFAVFNPGDQPAQAMLEFLGANHQTHSVGVRLPAHTQATVTLDDTTSYQPDNDFSTVVESDQPVVVDRTMSWDKSGYGSHAETSIEAPQTTWYMAEGSTGGSFDLFYLLQNPGETAADVTVTYLLPAPAAPVVKHYTVDPKSRRTIHVDEEDPAVQFTDVSAKVTSTQPILVERAMYFSTPSQAFAAGHEGAAVTAPASSWFLAEGATGSFFDLFLLLANAETTDADVKVTYLLPIGDPIVKHYDVKAQSRRTINVDFEDPRLIDTPVSTIVESAVPVIAERAMWWPSPNWYEAHLSAGTTTTGTRWALAEGYVSDTAGKETETFILIANTSNAAGTADVTLYISNNSGGSTPVTKTFQLPANSRTNVRVQTDFPDALNKTFGTIIQSNGVPIVVERAMYSNANGQTWAAGTDALATKLQ
jgi:hypothetical protein